MWTKKKYRPLTCQEAKSELGQEGQHNFEPRYDERYPAIFENFLEMQGQPILEKIYVCDVCTYCGEVKRRGEVRH